MAGSTNSLDRVNGHAFVQVADKSPEAIARRRELDRRAVASNALEGCHRSPDSEYIHEMWILGEISDEQCHDMIAQYLRVKFAR